MTKYIFLADSNVPIFKAGVEVSRGSSEISDPARIATTLREQADVIAAALFEVVDKHGFRVSLDRNRQYIHAQLQQQHGQANYALIRPVVDMIIDRAQTLVSTRILERSPFVSAAELLRRPTSTRASPPWA